MYADCDHPTRNWRFRTQLKEASSLFQWLKIHPGWISITKKLLPKVWSNDKLYQDSVKHNESCVVPLFWRNPHIYIYCSYNMIIHLYQNNELLGLLGPTTPDWDDSCLFFGRGLSLFWWGQFDGWNPRKVCLNRSFCIFHVVFSGASRWMSSHDTTFSPRSMPSRKRCRFSSR